MTAWEQGYCVLLVTKNWMTAWELVWCHYLAHSNTLCHHVIQLMYPTLSLTNTLNNLPTFLMFSFFCVVVAYMCRMLLSA